MTDLASTARNHRGLDRIIAMGAGPDTPGSDLVRCADGFEMSVTANRDAYCTPRLDNRGPYTHVEVGYPSARPEPWAAFGDVDTWDQYAEDRAHPTDTVYAFVPVEMVHALVAAHGGEVFPTGQAAGYVTVGRLRRGEFKAMCDAAGVEYTEHANFVESSIAFRGPVEAVQRVRQWAIAAEAANRTGQEN